MAGLGLSFLALALSFLGAWRSLGAGMSAVLAWGYFYGILRARFPDGFSHFIFDAGILGGYLGHLARVGTLRPPNAPELHRWAILLTAWPFIIFALGALYPQHLLIQVVGLRTAAWFLPFLLLGAWARLADLQLMARTLAVLNLVALFFGVGEYFLGLEAFFPRNAVTVFLYNSNDVAGYSAHRIPATFVSSAVYGGVMVASMPWLVGGWLGAEGRLLEKLLMMVALLATALGAFLCASRTPVVVLLLMGLVVAHQLRTRLGYLLPALLVAAVVAYLVSGNERLQRFSSLQDRHLVLERITDSANLDVLELVLSYPMGAGLGSAFGTSIPSFLQPLVTQAPIGAENEYARMGIEQSMIGPILWIAFLVWLLSKRRVGLPGGWRTAERLMFLFVALAWVMALTGAGTMSTIPTTCLLLFQMGLLGRRPVHSPPPLSAARPTPTVRPALGGGQA
jgi:hypothetical protein